MIDIQEVKSRILDFIEEVGPTTPVKISKEIKMDPVWASAILAELINSKKLIMSSMRFGSSAYYLKPGQEIQLVPLADNVLVGTPKDAFLLLRQSKFLKDNTQEPQIRVALRSLKDFAIPFEYKNETYWRYSFLPMDEVNSFLAGEGSKENKENKEEVQDSVVVIVDEDAVGIEQEEEKKIEEDGVEESIAIENIFDENNQGELIERVRAYLEKKKIIMLEETDTKKKEFIGIGRMQTEVGEIEITIIAKDKKSINEKDIEKAYELIAEQKRLVLFLITGETAKKAIEIYRKHKNLIRIDKLV